MKYKSFLKKFVGFSKIVYILYYLVFNIILYYRGDNTLTKHHLTKVVVANTNSVSTE